MQQILCLQNMITSAKYVSMFKLNEYECDTKYNSSMNKSNEFACYALESYRSACLIIVWNWPSPALGPLDFVHPAHPIAMH